MLKGLWQFWTRPRGRQYWRVFIWATAGAGLIGIPLVTVFPDTVPLVWLWLVGIPANSPLAPLFPTAFEPLMMEVVKYQPVLTVTLTAVAIFVYMEFINWYVFAWVLSWERLAAVRDNRWVKWGLGHFAKSPYRTVFVFAATPIPFWVVRCLAILHQISFTRYMIAMALGRFPRLYVYAWLGDKIHVPWWALASVAVGTGVVIIVWRLLHRQPVLKDTVLDG